MFQTLNTEQRLTIILVTHDANVAHHAQRTIRIHDGGIAAGVFEASPTVAAQAIAGGVS